MHDEDFEESHGLFQRVIAPILINTPVPVQLTREQRLNAAAPTDYRPKTVHDGYFLSSTAQDLATPNRFSSTNLMYTLSFNYMRKDYRTCVDVSEQMIASLHPKVNFEVNETAARSYVKLGDYARALEHMSFAAKRSDPDHHVLLAQLYRLNGRLEEAFAMLRKYCKIRSEDSYAWAEISTVLMAAAVNPNTPLLRGCDRLKLGMCGERCMRFAVHLLTRFVPSGEFGVRAFKRVACLREELDKLTTSRAVQFFVDAMSENEELNEIVTWIARSTVKMESVYVETVEVSQINE